jgi:hypothetical protein
MDTARNGRLVRDLMILNGAITRGYHWIWPPIMLLLLNTVHPYTAIFVTIETVGSKEVYTDCDGIPRARFTGSPTGTYTKTVTVINTHTQWNQTSEVVYFYSDKTGYRPYCLPSREYCTRKKARFLENLMLSASKDLRRPITKTPYQKGCDGFGSSDHFCKLWSDYEVMLFYWPPNLTSRNICAADGAWYGIHNTMEYN